MDSSSGSEVDSGVSLRKAPTTAASSPPERASPKDNTLTDSHNEDALIKEEEEARIENDKAEEKRQKAMTQRRRKKKAETKAERESKASELDQLLMKSAAFSDILTKKTQALGRVGSSLDGKTLGEHNLELAKQPKCMVGGTMRDYQLEGLTWMFEICSQGMSGILADEMGLGMASRKLSFAPYADRNSRQDDSDHCAYCSSARTRGLSWSASDCCTS